MSAIANELEEIRTLIVDLDRGKLNKVNTYLRKNGAENIILATSISAAKEHLQSSEFDVVYLGVDKERTGLAAFSQEVNHSVPEFKDINEIINEMNEKEDNLHLELLDITSEAVLQGDIDNLFMNANFINAQFQEINLDLNVLEIEDDHLTLSTRSFRENNQKLTLCLDYNIDGLSGNVVLNGKIFEVEVIEETQTLKFVPQDSDLEKLKTLQLVKLS